METKYRPMVGIGRSGSCFTCSTGYRKIRPLYILLFVRDDISITIFITISAFVLTLVLGLIGALGRTSHGIGLYTLFPLYMSKSFAVYRSWYSLYGGISPFL